MNNITLAILGFGIFIDLISLTIFISSQITKKHVNGFPGLAIYIYVIALGGELLSETKQSLFLPILIVIALSVFIRRMKKYY